MNGPHEHDTPRVTVEDYARGATADFGDIEIVGGRVVRSAPEGPVHSRVVRRLAAMFEARRDGRAHMIVDSGVAVRFADTDHTATDHRLNIRHPDLYIRGRDPYDVNTVRDHILLIVEVTSESTIDVDITDKRIQYAAAGISRYLVVRLDQRQERIEQIEEYCLDRSGRRYRTHAVHRRVLLLDEPVVATIPFDILEQP